MFCWTMSCGSGCGKSSRARSEKAEVTDRNSEGVQMTASDPVVALDAMGGDNAPGAIVQGAVMAARRLGARAGRVGQTEALGRGLGGLGPAPEPATARTAPERIGMREH